MNAHRFPIGTQYVTVRGTGRKAQKDLNTVVDQMTVTNSKGEVVGRFYVAEHQFCGQSVISHNVCDTTIARNLTADFVHLLTA